MKILAIIPARGGSKGIPRKNIADVCGKPLIQYSIDIGLEAIQRGLISACIVSTDDLEIAEIAKKLGADVPFLRPAEISNDKAKSVDFILHAIQYYEEKDQFFDAILLLQPTSPIRSIGDVEKIIDRLLNSKNESIISVYQEDHVHELVSYHEQDGVGIPLNKNHNAGVRRQEHRPVFVRNGAFYLTKTQYILDTHRVFSDHPLLYIMSKNQSVNLDVPEDLELLRLVIGYYIKHND